MSALSRGLGQAMPTYTRGLPASQLAEPGPVLLCGSGEGRRGHEGWWPGPAASWAQAPSCPLDVGSPGPSGGCPWGVAAGGGPGHECGLCLHGPHPMQPAGPRRHPTQAASASGVVCFCRGGPQSLLTPCPQPHSPPHTHNGRACTAPPRPGRTPGAPHAAGARPRVQDSGLAGRRGRAQLAWGPQLGVKPEG